MLPPAACLGPRPVSPSRASREGIQSRSEGKPCSHRPEELSAAPSGPQAGCGAHLAVRGAHLAVRGSAPGRGERPRVGSSAAAVYSAY